jgi:uncharacterized protein (TIGR03437 family)
MVPYPLVLLIVCALLGAEKPEPRVAPFYSAASIVNAADNQSGELAANTIGTIYGANLAYGTAAISSSDIRNGLLPIVLGDDETQVFIAGSPANLYYVSPTQINFLVPPDLLALPAPVYVTVDSLRGPIIKLTLGPAAPGLFQLDAANAIATLPNGNVLTPCAPAQPGDTVVLWATGLGPTDPQVIYDQLPTSAAPLANGANLSVLLNGTPVPAQSVSYAGIAAGFPGLYQVNFQLPMSTGANPEIRIQVRGVTSAAKVYLPVLESSCS